MKKIIKLTIAYIILGNYNAQAQCWENINTATTDWRKNNSANTWNWTQENFDVYLTNQTGATQVKSPFWVTQGASTNNNPHLWDFRKYITADKKDFHPEDGWELVTKQFGILSNNESEKETNPFFALYNKYTGKLRCFLLIVNGENNFNTGAMLHIEFERGVRKTGLFQHMKPIAKEVLNFDPLINSQNPNFIINTNYYWLFSETVVAYDPCTCFEYPSTIADTNSIIGNFYLPLPFDKRIEYKNGISQYLLEYNYNTRNYNFDNKSYSDRWRITSVFEKHDNDKITKYERVIYISPLYFIQEFNSSKFEYDYLSYSNLILTKIIQ